LGNFEEAIFCYAKAMEMNYEYEVAWTTKRK